MITGAHTLCQTLNHFLLPSSSAVSDRHKRGKARTTRRRLQITLAESLSLWKLSMYELFLWVKGSRMLHWLTVLLAFLHWDVRYHNFLCIFYLNCPFSSVEIHLWVIFDTRLNVTVRSMLSLLHFQQVSVVEVWCPDTDLDLKVHV